MDFLKWAKQQKLPSALQSRSGWGEIFEHYRSNEPHIHQIEPTNHCPYICVMCPRHTNMSRKKGYMDLALYKTIIDEISTYSDNVKEKEIELFHFGESLLHPDIAEMVGYLSDHDLKGTLSINPCDLSPKLINDLCENPPYKIIISIDSMHAEKYRFFRGNKANIETAIHNSKSLINKFQVANHQCEIIVRMIVMNENLEEKESFRDYWEKQGATVELRQFFPWNDQKLSDLGQVEKYPPYMPCPFPWQYLVIQWNGDVVSCCRDYNGMLKVGNVLESRLIDIWNGELCKGIREKMTSGVGLDQMCEECLTMYYTDGKA